MKKAKKHKITVKYVEDLPVSILADIADVLGGRIRFDLVPLEMLRPQSEPPAKLPKKKP